MYKKLHARTTLEVDMSKKCTPLWREAHSQVKMHKTLQCRTAFGSWPVEKVHAVVARSTFRSQNVQSTSVSDPFWKLRCRKSTKKRTPLWREAHSQVKMHKTPQCRTAFGSWPVEKVHAVVARSTFRSQNVQSPSVSDHFWKLRCRKSTKKRTPLWREAHSQVKTHKTPQCRTAFGSWPVEKVHAVVARSTFRSQNVQSTSVSDHFWKLRCRKSTKKCTPLWREAHFEVKMCKALQCRTTFGSWDVEKALKSARRCGAKHMSKSHMQKIDGYGALLDVQMSFCVAGARDCAPCQKGAKREGFVAFQKQWQVGTFEEDLQRCFLMAGAVQETHELDMLGGQGADFLRGVAFWSIGSSGLLRWFCVTGGALRMTWLPFSWQAQYFRQMEWNNRKMMQNAFVRGRQLCTQLSIFEGSLAELLRFWCCQLRTLNKSRRIASILTLSSSKIVDGQIAR